jgi:hypothetical protein
MPTKTYSPADVRKIAEKAYAKELASYGDDAPNALLPALAKREIAKRTGLPISRLASLVDPVYFRENGLRNPLPLPASRTPRSLAVAIRKRRDAGGTLGRYETLAASASAALGRPVSEAAVRALYAKGGGDPDASYTGRGTRVGAPKTRASETAEVETTLA